MWLKIKEYYNGKPILFGQNSVRTPYGVTMTDANVLANSEGKKLIPEGSFIVSVGDSIRFLPRAKVKTAVTTAQAAITVKSPSFSFKTGDVLYAVAGYAEVTIGGTVAEDDVLTIKINGVNYSVTAGSAVNATEAAAWITANSSDLTDAGITATQKGSSATIILHADNAYSIHTYSTNGETVFSVNTTEQGYLGDALMPVGTISAIGAANADGERVITLAANAAYALPANSNVGVVVDKFIGIYPHHLDFTDTPMEHIAPICEADGVYEQNLPYVDMQLKRQFRDLRIDKRFYKNV